MSDERIVAALRALARESSALGPSTGVEEKLLAAFDAQHAAGVGRRREWLAWLAAAAAIVLVSGGFWLAQRDLANTPDLKVGPTYVTTTDFVAWPGAAALPAFESGQIVRTELPASVLPLLGIPETEAPAGDRVVADVLYAQDGLARAVRIVRDQSMHP